MTQNPNKIYEGLSALALTGVGGGIAYASNAQLVESVSRVIRKPEFMRDVDDWIMKNVYGKDPAQERAKHDAWVSESRPGNELRREYVSKLIEREREYISKLDACDRIGSSLAIGIVGALIARGIVRRFGSKKFRDAFSKYTAMPITLPFIGVKKVYSYATERLKKSRNSGSTGQPEELHNDK